MIILKKNILTFLVLCLKNVKKNLKIAKSLSLATVFYYKVIIDFSAL